MTRIFRSPRLIIIITAYVVFSLALVAMGVPYTEAALATVGALLGQRTFNRLSHRF